MQLLQTAKTAAKWYRNPVIESARDWAAAPSQSSSLLEAAVWGFVAGAVGNIVLNLSNQAEQAATGRPNSYVPGHTWERLFGMRERPDAESNTTNHAFQWGVATTAGVARGLMSRAGMRGPYATFIHIAMRVCLDQSLEHVAKTSSPPWTWPMDEQLLDMAHKGAYAVVTGALTDWLVVSSRRAASNRRGRDASRLN